MPTIEIFYPQLGTYRVEVIVTDERLEEIRQMTTEEKERYISSMLSRHEHEKIPGTLESAIECGYAGIIEKKHL